MVNNYIIIGNSSFSFMIYKYMKESIGTNILAFVADSKYIKEKEFASIPIIDFTTLFQNYDNKIKLIMGIGYSQMANIREEKFKLCKENGFSFANYIHPSANIHSTVKLGEGNVIFENVDIQADAEIGNGNLFLAGAFFGHDSKAGDYNTFCVKSVVTGFVEIRNHCFIGTLATMNNRIIIDDYSFLGATVYASHGTQKNTIVVPNKCKYMPVEDGGYLI